MPTPAEMQQIGQRPDMLLLALCVDDASPLSHLVNYLKRLNMPLDSGENILRALEEPIYWNKMDDLVKQAWEFHFADKGAYFEQNYRQLLLAEAWLRAEAEAVHGGKRERNSKKE
ncbi:hypothetical protein FACS1894206_10170 [Deltaproteobacteria bacterium]|nr:hypothetical protein FACS1894206_10170 [Deltaproteobacteria bacterium]